MKPLLLALSLLLVADQAHAISRYTSTSMSCARVQQTIRQDGAAIMRYGSTRNPGLQLYGRYVADRRYCEWGEAAVSTTIPAADRQNCPVRECQTVDFDDPFLLPQGGWRN